MAGRTTIVVPDLGEFHDVEVIDVLVKAGDAVEVESPLVTLETDKATMDVPSTAAGRVAGLAVKKGDRVSKGDAIVELETGEAPAVTSGGSAKAERPPDQGRAAAAAQPAAVETGAAPAAAAGTMLEVRVPDLGDFKDVEVIEVLVAESDRVALETPLITLETEKATMDVPSSAAGRIARLHVAKGARVNTGDVVATVRGEANGAAPPAAAPAGKAAPTAPAAPTADAAPATATAAPAARPTGAAETGTTAAPLATADLSRAHAGPAVRRLARELGVDLARVTGTGVKGRISQDDVKAFVKKALSSPPQAAGAAGLPRVPEVDFAAFGPVEVRPLGRIQRISGARLAASWVNLPHVTQHEEADITELEALRASLKERAAGLGIKLTPLAFIARACVRVIAQFPDFNASLDASGQNLVLKKYLHLGFAADTPNGLVVPVIRDAGRKDIYELARDLGELAAKARAGKLSAAEMQGGCFTISSLGGIGGTAFTPIINSPEVAILGVSRSQQRPVWRDGRFEPRLILTLSLSYDHRVIDGAAAVRFVVALAAELANPQGLTEAVP
jgi:pyruvate dehydrogenase E2 component (dihydrolipoamide acetyltransferase)